MSGRLFVPPVLNGVNLFTDFAALTLEQKFAKAFVRYMSGKRRYMHGIWEMNVTACPKREAMMPQKTGQH